MGFDPVVSREAGLGRFRPVWFGAGLIKTLCPPNGRSGYLLFSKLR